MPKIERHKIVPMLRQAAEFQREHRGIVYEHGVRLVDLVAQWGDVLADAFLKASELYAHEIVRNRRYIVKDASGASIYTMRREPPDLDVWVLRDMDENYIDATERDCDLMEWHGISMFHEEPE